MLPRRVRLQFMTGFTICLPFLFCLILFLLFPTIAFSVDDPFFGDQPGGKTIGGPSSTILKAGTEKELLTFLRSGPDPFVFVCTTGMNKGSGMVSLMYRTRIGGTKTSKFAPRDSMVACGEVTAISIECHSGQHSHCEFLWRIDVLR